MARMRAMRHMRRMGSGGYSYRMPEEARETIDVADDTDDESGLPWDFENQYTLENEDEMGEDD